MARTVEEIKKEMTSAFIANPVIIAAYELDPLKTFEEQFSKASIESIFFYDVAHNIYVTEQNFDTEKNSLIQYVEKLRPHTQAWYINTLKAFQLGDILDRETGKYDVVDEKKQIIKYCSLRKKNDELYFLIATDNNGIPQKISGTGVITAIWQYAERVFDAGVRFKIFSNDADKYRCKLLINYDPLVLDGSGKRLDGTNDTPVADAINNYFKSFPFDSEFSNMALTDAIQQVEGVRVVQLLESSVKPDVFSPFMNIESTYIANAGHMQYEETSNSIIYVI